MRRTRAAAQALSRAKAHNGVPRAGATATTAAAVVQGSRKARSRPQSKQDIDEASNREATERGQERSDRGAHESSELAATPPSPKPKRRRSEVVVPAVPAELLCYSEGSPIHVGTSGYR
jgi:hypothetical protein